MVARRTSEVSGEFSHYEWNPASGRVLEKAGYVLEGRMRRSAIKDGKVIDQFLYAYVVPPAAAPAPTEWRGRKGSLHRSTPPDKRRAVERRDR